jgi:cytochrome b
MGADSAVAVEAAAGQARVRVWDLFVRFFHWTVVVAFFVAYFSEDGPPTLHVRAGYTVGVVVVLRVLWGFLGPKHARFSDFVCGPVTAARYLIDLLAFRAKRYLGHSPAGGAMALALLLGLLATVGTGLELYAVEENAGPLAAVSGGSRTITMAGSGLLVLVDDDSGERAGWEGYEGREFQAYEEKGAEFWEEAHEVLANLTLALAIFHVLGVVVASIVHRENLAWAMVTGFKRAD